MGTSSDQRPYWIWFSSYFVNHIQIQYHCHHHHHDYQSCQAFKVNSSRSNVLGGLSNVTSNSLINYHHSSNSYSWALAQLSQPWHQACHLLLIMPIALDYTHSVCNNLSKLSLTLVTVIQSHSQQTLAELPTLAEFTTFVIINSYLYLRLYLQLNRISDPCMNFGAHLSSKMM